MDTAGLATSQSGVNVWRFSAIMSTALTMSAAVAHVMELPAKMRYEPSFYLRLHRTLMGSRGDAR
jgi:hypothetical protein